MWPLDVAICTLKNDPVDLLPSGGLMTVSMDGLSGFEEDNQNPDAAGTFSPLGPASPGSPSAPGKPGRPWWEEEEEVVTGSEVWDQLGGGY